MNKIAAIAAMASGLVYNFVDDEIHAPYFRGYVSDWKHSDERLRKAEEKRARKAAKRVKEQS